MVSSFQVGHALEWKNTMWHWVIFCIGLFLGIITGIVVIAMLKQISQPERVSHYETEDRKDSLRVQHPTEGTLPMSSGKIVAFRSRRSQLN